MSQEPQFSATDGPYVLLFSEGHTHKYNGEGVFSNAQTREGFSKVGSGLKLVRKKKKSYKGNIKNAFNTRVLVITKKNFIPQIFSIPNTNVFLQPKISLELQKEHYIQQPIELDIKIDSMYKLSCYKY